MVLYYKIIQEINEDMHAYRTERINDGHPEWGEFSIAIANPNVGDYLVVADDGLRVCALNPYSNYNRADGFSGFEGLNTKEAIVSFIERNSENLVEVSAEFCEMDIDKYSAVIEAVQEYERAWNNKNGAEICGSNRRAIKKLTKILNEKEAQMKEISSEYNRFRDELIIMCRNDNSAEYFMTNTETDEEMEI